MAAWMRGKRARLGALAAACAAMVALAVTLGLAQRDDAPDATATTATTTVTTALSANPSTCTARTLGVSRASNPGLAADCDALLAIDRAFSLNWSAGAALRSWRGVTLGGRPERVTGLDLSDNRLTGSIPAQLGGLTALMALDLSGNTLSGDLPAGLRDMPPTLATLHLAGNSFTGCVDERLRLAETNDLATLMGARGLGWCPVALAPDDGTLTRGATYQIFRGRIIVDIPATGPPIQLSALVSWSSIRGGGYAYCFSDINKLETVCLDGITGEEWSRGTIEPDRRDTRGEAFGSSSTPTPPPGLDAAFDALVASARPAPWRVWHEAQPAPDATTCTARTLGVPRESNPELAADCDALLAIKSALSVSGWSAGVALRHWWGVTLGGTPERVTGLDLSDNRLTGSIPTQLGGLAALTALDLSGNMLSGDLPAWLRDMPPTLATLRLSGNSFTGCIDERLRLAETNDLATLMTARGLGWCPVAAMPVGSALTAAATYQVHGGTIIDIPSTGPQVQYVIGVTSDGGGEAFCLADMSRRERVCIDGRTGEEWSRGRIPPSLRESQSVAGSGASGTADTPTPVSGLEEVFDQIVASARSAP